MEAPLVAPIERGGWRERFLKDLRGFVQKAGESMPTQEERIAFEREERRRNYYGCLKKGEHPSPQNFNFASIPHPSEELRGHMKALYQRLLAKEVSREEREAMWQVAREKACQLINHPDPRGVLLAGNTTQALGYFHFLSGMLHDKNRVSILHQVLTMDIENAATYRAIATLGEDGNPHRHDGLTTYSNWLVCPEQESKRRFSFATFNRLKTHGQTLDEMKEQMRKKIRWGLVATTLPDTLVLSHVDRETGRELPVRQLIEYGRELKAKADPKHPRLYCVVDGAQALGNLPRVDWKELGADMYVASPHKTMGAERLGIAYFNPDDPLVQDGLKLLRHPAMHAFVPISDGTFHPDLKVEAVVRTDGYYRDLTGIDCPEVNPIEVSAFSQSVDELTASGLLNGNDFSALDKHRRMVKHYCQMHLLQLSEQSGIPITIPEVDHPTNFILAFRIGPEKAPKRGMSFWQSLLPERWRPAEREQFGHEIGRLLNEQGIALTYFSDPNLFRLSFDRETTLEGIDQFIAVLASVLRQIPELTQRQAS